jgi:Tfp pilus assembly protein PilN
MSDKQNKEHSKISLRIGNVQVELEGTYDNIKKLMDKELYDFAKGLEETSKKLPPSTEMAPKIAPKAPEVAPKEKTVPPPSKPSITQAPAQTSRVPTPTKTTEKKSKRRSISRNAVIALVLVLVLLAALVSVIAIYVPMVGSLESQIAEQNNTIDSLNNQNLAIQSALSQITTESQTKDDRIAELTDQVNTIADNLTDYYTAYLAEANDVINLGKSENWLSNYAVTQDANSSTTVWGNAVNYAGYVTVAVRSTSNSTYAAVGYSYNDVVNYNSTVTLGTSGGAAFPVLPGPIFIAIGNTDVPGGASVNANVTVNYIY